MGIAFIAACIMIFMMMAQSLYAEGIQVTYPNNGDEYWVPGFPQPQIIKWSYNELELHGSRVKIELLKSGIVNQVYYDIPIGSGGMGAFRWNVPLSQPIGCDYRIRVATIKRKMEISDISDNNFCIMNRKVRLIMPNGGESWGYGSTQQIRWTSSGFPPGSIASLSLEKLGQGCKIVDNLSLSSGSYTWTVGRCTPWPGSTLTGDPGSDYRITVNGLGPEPGHLWEGDSSDQPFSIIKIPRIPVPRSTQK